MQPNLLNFFFLDDKAAGKKKKNYTLVNTLSPFHWLSMDAVRADSNVYEPADLQNTRTQTRAQGSHHQQHTLIKGSACQRCMKIIVIILSRFLLSFEDFTWPK